MRKLALVPVVALTLGSCGSLARNVDIDIDPESDTNCIPDYAYGAVPVAILGSAELDVRQIDLASVVLLLPQVGARGRAETSRVRYVHSNLDAYEDVVLQIVFFRDSFRTYIGPATLTAKLIDGTPIKGTDSVCVAQDRTRRYP